MFKITRYKITGCTILLFIGNLQFITGNDCEMEEDGCQNDPCSVNRNCTDLTPSQQVLLGKSYNCSQCPDGYTEQNEQCQGRYKPTLDLDRYIYSRLKICSAIFNFPIYFSPLHVITGIKDPPYWPKS